MQNQATVRFPILYTADVFIAGAGSSAVSAALAARKAGRRVFVASDLTYFGDESAGALRLFPKRESAHPLFQRMFPGGLSSAPTPLSVKRALETALLEADIPFLYGVRPVALLRREDGRIGGVVLAAHTSLYAVLTTQLVDATRQGLLARLAGLPLAPRGASAPPLEWTVLAAGAPDEIDSRAYLVLDTGRAWQRLQTTTGEAEARIYSIEFPAEPVGPRPADRAGLEHRLKSRVLDGHVVYTADQLLIPTLDRGPGGSFLALNDLRDRDFAASDQLWLCNGLLPVTAEALSSLDTPAVQLELGERVGRLVAEHEAEPTSDLAAFRLDAGGTEARGPFRFAPSFVRPGQDVGWIEAAFDAAPELGVCDVLVAGGGTGGAPAAIAAAREGARTILVEWMHGLGGVGTLGFIASYCYGNRVGFTREMDEGLAKTERVRTEKRTGSWSPELKNAWYQRTLYEAGGIAWFGSFVFGVLREGDRLAALLVSTPFGSGLLRANAVVDASGNADLAAAAGAPVRWIGAQHVAVQGAGLSPRQLGQYYSNTDHSFTDDNDPVGVTYAFASARKKFADQFDISTMVNTRERRQIIGDIELSPLDFLARRTFPDTIAIARSNFDTHGFTVHPVFLIVPPNKETLWAQVPFRCLLPRGTEGVIVTGLGMSAHRDALPVVRMQADVQNHGYAAGLACAMVARAGLRLRDLNIRRLQQRLVALGALPEEVLTQQDSFPLPSETVRNAAREGPVDLYHAAVILAHPEESAPVLIETIRNDPDAERRERAALALGLMHRPEAAMPLVEIVRSRGWDAGWNFTGMDQFGFSMSRMDALLVALGRAGIAAGGDALTAARHAVREKADALNADAFFSHCRAVAVAAAGLGGEAMMEALVRLLQLPGMTGHALTDMAQAVATVSSERNETRSRNLALREIYLARALYLCGDRENLGRKILERYTHDLRGPFARHATAVLAEKDLDRLRTESL